MKSRVTSNRVTQPKPLSLTFQSLAISAIVAAILLPLTYLYFKRVEATMADVI